MRKAFIQSLQKLASADGRVVLLTGDLGYQVLEGFIKEFPSRFFNVGAAEQNMLGLATGLAEAGFIPFVYSIAPFAALRPFEFIRNGPVYHNLPVRIVGVGQGVEYGFNGHSHYALEDVAVLRTQPNLTIIAPADNAQTQNALEGTHDLPGPIYFRLSKDSLEIPDLRGEFSLGRAQQIGNGKDALIVSSGAITKEAVSAAHSLTERGISATVLVIASIAPISVQYLIEALSRFDHAFTVESHYITGGIGSLIAEIVAEHGLRIRVIRLGFDAVFNDTIGASSFIHNANGLTANQIFRRILKVLEENA